MATLAQRIFRSLRRFRIDNNHPNSFRAYEEATPLLIFEDYHPIEFVRQVRLYTLRIRKSNESYALEVLGARHLDFGPSVTR